MKTAIITGTVVLALSAAPAFAEGQQARKSAKSEGKAKSDQAFVMEAAKGGLAEVELGKLAGEKGSNDQVKQFGQKMVTDHGKANDELKSLAQSKNITLPAAVDPKDKALHDRLEKLSGDAFDRAYIQEMVKDHRKDVNAFKHESTAGKDPEIKSWASKTLPTLEEHLKQAQDASHAVATSGSAAGNRTTGTRGVKK